ncbi:MAG: hypothetical protein M0R73_13530 [Dehalococcoidia bacterium]|nr:hypothetical protein [Dehalococcoidia bacterium]
MPRINPQHRVPLAALVLALVVALVPAPLAAQEPSATTMVIEVSLEDEWEFLGEGLFVFVGETHCATATEAAADVTLGTADQDSACGTPDETITFLGANGGLFFETAIFTGGTSFSLMNPAPVPPHTAYPAFVCAFLASEGIDRTDCDVIGPPGAVAVWQFAPKFIFGDERAVTALVSLMDGAPVEYAVPLSPANGDELPLLQASGTLDIDEEPQVAEARTCRVWHPDDAPGLLGLAEALSDELVDVFGDLGLAITPCERTADAASADLLLWREADPTPVDFTAFTMDGSFLVSTYTPPPAPHSPPLPPGAPQPADAGNAGRVAASEGRGGTAIALLMLGLTLAGAAGARAIARG